MSTKGGKTLHILLLRMKRDLPGGFVRASCPIPFLMGADFLVLTESPNTAELVPAAFLNEKKKKRRRRIKKERKGLDCS